MWPAVLALALLLPAAAAYTMQDRIVAHREVWEYLHDPARDVTAEPW